MEENEVDEWPWVKFFKRNKKLWTLNAVKHSVLETDVMKKTAPPGILMCGTRILYL
ncbi:hypothetical protein DPMN_191681 [Dreissena polymorpha]|uniref:Uncharacterized protein n=1 Tax=Dreissena polymorpha TaxID=45954 RepID=A0A9D3Y2Z8_DREPO|nr:hypothetical protein DPMN_191681 [Dreissena polymorpha]